MNKVTTIFNQLVGQKCWCPWRGYGMAIFFDFGRKITTSKIKQFQRGSYSFCLDMSPWQILQQNKEIGNYKQSYKQIDSLLPKFKNQTIEKINIFRGLAKTQIVFSNDLIIQTQHSNKSYQWYLLTPKMELVVGYNCNISIKDLTEN